MTFWEKIMAELGQIYRDLSALPFIGMLALSCLALALALSFAFGFHP